jgi:hypothetical protein
MPVARKASSDFISRHEPLFLPDDLKALKSSAPNLEPLTGLYIADPAPAHRMKPATFDTRISHRVVEIMA